MRQLTVCATVAVLCVSLGCSDGGGNPMAAGVPVPGSSFTYAALGASDVVGVGSSQPCAAPFQDCNGNSYVFVAARQLRTQGYTVTVSPLGISGAVIAKILGEELPLVPREAKLVTIFTGGNDVKGIAVALNNGLGGSDPNGYIDQGVATFKSDFATLVAGTRSRAPDAKIVVLNLTNLAGLPFLAAATLQQKQWGPARLGRRHPCDQCHERHHRCRSHVPHCPGCHRRSCCGWFSPERQRLQCHGRRSREGVHVIVLSGTADFLQPDDPVLDLSPL